MKFNKKRQTLTILTLLTLLQSPAAQALTCPADSGGIQLLDYCGSRQSEMNYWSAETWCHAIGGRLVDIISECELDCCEDEPDTVDPDDPGSIPGCNPEPDTDDPDTDDPDDPGFIPGCNPEPGSVLIGECWYSCSRSILSVVGGSTGWDGYPAVWTSTVSTVPGNNYYVNPRSYGRVLYLDRDSIRYRPFIALCKD